LGGALVALRCSEVEGLRESRFGSSLLGSVLNESLVGLRESLFVSARIAVRLCANRCSSLRESRFGSN
jgi:hypothetical protein